MPAVATRSTHSVTAQAFTHRSSQRGVTMIELLIAVALVALLTGGVATGLGAFGSTRLRASATMILGGVRVAMTQANTTGYPTRLVFDLDQRLVTLEQSNARMLRKTDDRSREEDPSAGAAAATEAEREAAEASKRILEGPREAPLCSWPRRLSAGTVVVHSNRKSHSRACKRNTTTNHVRTAGPYLYFWPGGGTEKAVIVLTRPGMPDGTSIVVSSLTGRASILKGTIEFDRPGDDVDFGEREVE